MFPFKKLTKWQETMFYFNIGAKNKLCIRCFIFPDPQAGDHTWSEMYFYGSHLFFCLYGTEVCDHPESHTSGALKAPLTFHEAVGHG